MDLQTDSAAICEQTDSSQTRVKEWRVVKYPYFARNLNVIAALLALAKHRALKEFLTRDRTLETSLRARLLAHLHSTLNMRTAAGMILRDLSTEAAHETFLNGLWPFLEAPLADKIKSACFGDYTPAISEYMYQLIENRPNPERRLILDALSGKTHQDYDRAAVKNVLAPWILRKQRQASYYISFHAASGFVDAQAENDLETFVQDTLNFELVHIPSEVRYCLCKHLNAQDKMKLIQTMWNDLIETDQSRHRDLISSLILWLSHRQRQSLIKNSLENGIYVWQEILSLVQSTLVDVPPFFQTRPSTTENALKWADFSQRWASFLTATWESRHSQLSHEMANEGFHLVKTRPHIPSEDTVACYSCAVRLNRWERGDDPALEHLWYGKTDCEVLQSKHTDEFMVFVHRLRFTGAPKPKNLKAAHEIFREKDEVDFGLV